MRLIDAQAAIELAMQYCPDDDGTCSKADEDIRNLLDELENLPSVQPDCTDCIMHGGDWECDHVHCHKGRPKGEWLHEQLIPDDITGHTYGECSNCGHIRIIDNFCPHCGADNRGKQDDSV